MKTIMLVCSAGMSTSLLVQKMQEAAKQKGIEATIFAVSVSQADESLAEHDVDVLLFGPQVRYLVGQYQTKLAGQSIPVEAINMMDYGMMNGEKVLEHALTLIEGK